MTFSSTWYFSAVYSGIITVPSDKKKKKKKKKNIKMRVTVMRQINRIVLFGIARVHPKPLLHPF